MSSSSKHWPIEISPPDIRGYQRGNTGVDYFHCFDSGRTGPHIAVTALVHGNEYCGALALEWLLQKEVKPLQGSLTLGFVNVDAFFRFCDDDPTASRFVDEDFNRLWSASILDDGDRRSVEAQRARAIRPLIDTVDVLLDLHSMQQPSPSLMMCGPLQKGQDLGQRVAGTEFCVTDSGHAAGKRMRDYDRFLHSSAQRNALLVECGQHWVPSSVTIAKKTLARFLLECKVLVAGVFADEPQVLEPIEPRVVEVSGPYTIRHDRFEFAMPVSGMEVIPEAGTLIGRDGDEPVFTPYDDCVLVMPSMRLYQGQTAVRFGRILDANNTG